MLKRFYTEYLQFSAKERNGIYLLSSLIMLILILPFFYPFLTRQPVYGHKEFETAITRLHLQQSTSNNQSAINSPGENHYTNNSITDNDIGYPEIELFCFDPNTLSAEGWKKLGLKDKTIQTIQNYLSKGGHFYIPQDIGKVWGIRQDQVKKLLPYIKIEKGTDAYKSVNKTEKKYSFEKVAKPAGNNIIDINIADTAAFISLPGIGSKLAGRIITFRNKLGGFYKVEQVAETFGLPDSVYQKIKPGLISGNTLVKQFNINTAGIEEMKTHPYFQFVIANAIVQYRSQHGHFTKIEDIKKIMIVTQEIYTRIAPYLKVE